MNQATIDFIRQHQEDDVRLLAFLGSKYPEVDRLQIPKMRKIPKFANFRPRVRLVQNSPKMKVLVIFMRK